MRSEATCPSRHRPSVRGQGIEGVKVMVNIGSCPGSRSHLSRNLAEAPSACPSSSAPYSPGLTSNRRPRTCE